MKKRGITICMTALAAIALLVTSSASAQNLLGNSSFESTLEYGSPMPGNWFAFFGAGSTGTFSTSDGAYSGAVMPVSGANHLSIANDGTPGGFSGVFQSAGAIAGQIFNFDVDAKWGNGLIGPIGADLKVEFFDGGGGFLSDSVLAIGPSTTTSYQNFSINNVVAPATTASVQAVIVLETFSTSGFAGNLFADDASLVAVPEPASVALLGLGALGLITRRRRS